MTSDQQIVARECLAAAESDRMTFPEIVARLIGAGFDGYQVDFRRGDATYYLGGGEAFILPLDNIDAAVADHFDASGIASAVRTAQQQAPGYTYRGFCRAVMAAGCAGYIVSFPGRRVLYLGRTGDMHIEHFPD